MTVKALRDRLADLPDDMKVLVEGYEGGYDPLLPENIIVSRFLLGPPTPAWEGEYDQVYGERGEQMLALER